jgi:hypothetical protein
MTRCSNKWNPIAHDHQHCILPKVRCHAYWAHKAVTTHLQRSLLAQQQALSEAGIRYYGPDKLRRPNKGLGDIFGLDVYVNSRKPTRSGADQADFMF